MSINAIAVLPGHEDLRGEAIDDEWFFGDGPVGIAGLWHPLNDGILLNLELSINSPDIDLFEAVRIWLGDPPAKIWVFPDTAVPDADTIKEIQSSTREVGRWIVQSTTNKRSILEELGLSTDEVQAWQREINSGDKNRIQSAVAKLEKRLEGLESDKIESLLASVLRLK